VYRVRLLWVNFASLDLPRVMPMTCGRGKAAGQRVAQALICKQGVGGSSPLVSTERSPGRWTFRRGPGAPFGDEQAQRVQMRTSRAGTGSNPQLSIRSYPALDAVLDKGPTHG
jgi:hypothetical protein